MKIEKEDRVYIGIGLAILIVLVLLGFAGSLNTKSSGSSDSNTNIASSEAQANRISNTSPQSEAKAEVIKTNWAAYTDSIDHNWAIVTAVIRNTGKTNVWLNDASGTVYDAEGKVVGSSTASIYPRVLAPNEEAYTAVQISDTAPEEDIKDAKVQISFDSTEDEPIKLNAINDTGKRTSYDYEVVGELENTSEKEIEDARAIVLFFDAQNNLINAEIAYPTPEVVPPQGTVAFSASTSHLDDLVARYKVIGFSMQWGF